MVPVIRVRDLQFAYGTGSPAIRIRRWEVQEGERVGIVGSNGSGKTTLLLLLAGLLKGQGEVEVLGRPQPRAFQILRSHIGMLFADPDPQLLYPDLVSTRKALERRYDSARVARAWERYGLSALPNRPLRHLSPGWRKRLVLAELWIRMPRLWLLDEPATGLDPAMREMLARDCRTLPGTLVVATHDLDFVWEVCKRVLILNGGEPFMEGPVRTLLRDEENLRKAGLRLPLRLGGDHG